MMADHNRARRAKPVPHGRRNATISRVSGLSLSRRGALAVLAGGLAGGAGAGSGVSAGRGGQGSTDRRRAEQVRAEFRHVWDGYRRFAWGHDEFKPLSGGHREFFVSGSPIGLSLIEALDTLYVLELDGELDAAVRWIEQHLDFDIDGDFHVFEAIIRVVGGLLAGHLATGNPTLLARAVDLADRLLPAFASPTGMPYTYVDLRTGAVSGRTPPLAEIGSNILEFGVLSRLTGDPKYLAVSKNAYRAVLERRSPRDLLGTRLDVETGAWVDPIDTAPNPPVDSFYEYLWGGWALLGDRDCRDWFRLLAGGLDAYLVESAHGHMWYRQVDFRTGAPQGRRQSELASFWPEVLAHAGEYARARAYYDTWTALLERFAVLPEEIDYATLAVNSPANQFRPEYVNASFDLFLQTHDRYYAETAWQYFEAMRTHARVPHGYTIIDDVTTSPMRLGDLFPAYGFAENFKYLYLIFATTPRLDRASCYLSTEGKILRGLRR
jgi:mannosyl-oligosaccharide alpha-1,2-mannosidase